MKNAHYAFLAVTFISYVLLYGDNRICQLIFPSYAFTS